MALGGEHGLVTLHIAGDAPQVMVLHSPVAIPLWDGPAPCRWLEGRCWCLNSVLGLILDIALPDDSGPDCEATWAVMEQCYHLYLRMRR